MEKYKRTRLCIKCGHTDNIDRYYKGVIDGKEIETIKKICRNCGYSWYERPLDSVDKVDE